MKKVICTIFVISLLFTLPFTASAVELESHTATIMPRATISLSFNPIQAGSTCIANEVYYISNGDTLLNISSCTWTPAGQDIMIGFQNVDTNTQYGVVYSGGEIRSKAISTGNLPDGDYRVIVVNYGTKSVTGTLRYSVTTK